MLSKRKVFHSASPIEAMVVRDPPMVVIEASGEGETFSSGSFSLLNRIKLAWVAWCLERMWCNWKRRLGLPLDKAVRWSPEGMGSSEVRIESASAILISLNEPRQFSACFWISLLMLLSGLKGKKKYEMPTEFLWDRWTVEPTTGDQLFLLDPYKVWDSLGMQWRRALRRWTPPFLRWESWQSSQEQRLILRVSRTSFPSLSYRDHGGPRLLWTKSSGTSQQSCFFPDWISKLRVGGKLFNIWKTLTVFEFSVLSQLVHFNPTNRFLTHLK